MEEQNSQKPQKRSFLGTLSAIAWSFVGLRRREDYERDATSLNPFYVLIAGLIAVAIFIGLLLFVVKMVVP